MCGIVGYIIFPNQRDTSMDMSIFNKMIEKLHHRGPDGSGYWHNEGVFLGMRRLSIIDLEGGHQPIWNENKSCCVVFNGEIYNFMDLRNELESLGHIFGTKSDTEVIIHSYEQWGTECVRHFNGMFAFAIWDRGKNSLFLARDRIGEKPLYYYHDENRLVFASEIKSMLINPTIPREISPRGLSNYFAFGHSVAPDTILKNVYKLLPGHFLLAKEGRIKIEEYWDVGYESQISEGSEFREEEYSEKILEILNDSVRLRMIADVPVGAFLSGGVDSSAIAALMKRHASGKVKTFSLGFTVGGAYNELSDARKVAEYLGTEHYELEADHVDLINTLETLVYHYDEPFADAASFPLYLLSKFAREHVKVILSGDGGDELFGGYRRYAIDQFAPFYQQLPNSLIHRWIPDLISKLPRLRRFKKLINTLPISEPSSRYASWLISISKDMQAELFQPHFHNEVSDYDPTWPFHIYYSKSGDSYASDHLNNLMYVDLKTWLVDTYMEKTDKATMACGLEARLPILDYRLVEIAFKIPGRLKINGLKTKQIFKKAVNGLVPGSVIKKSKHGFAVPTDNWFRRELKNYSFEILFDEKTKRRNYINNNFVERIWKEHQRGIDVWDNQLWSLLNFELWCKLFLDGEGL